MGGWTRNRCRDPIRVPGRMLGGGSGDQDMATIDLNSDLGEGYGDYRMGDDEAMLRIVSSVNVACGFHAGDPQIMAKTFAAAKSAGVALGAAARCPERQRFGR